MLSFSAMNLILASKSPYRKELLSRLNIPFSCQASHVDEDIFKEKISDPVQLSLELAFQKAHVVYQDNLDSVVIGSDQVSVLEGLVLGKPHTEENAIHQLKLMAGKIHQLHTSVCVLGLSKPIKWTNTTNLTMRNLSEREIENYVTADQPLDCAGSYKIESLGVSLFDKVETEDFTAIVGLPLMQLSHYLNPLK